MKVGCYCRVSTPDQNLDRQIGSTTSYAQHELGVNLSELRVYRDKATGTNTSRDGYKRLMDDVEAGDVETVVVHEISRLARSLQDLDRTVSRVMGLGATIHFVRDGLSFGDGNEQPMYRLQMQMLGAFAEWEARVKQMNTREGIAARQANPEYHHGPAPLGFEKDDGMLIEGPQYDRVVAVLDMVQKGELSKRSAAKELDTSRRTISRALDRDSLYGL
ncbi:recombinase family protein [Haloferax marisrubri]|uniref:Resolvase n=1 Tax=Haloferax marisrubri TaxID=1544719 RepID=A0A2P4NNZ3_9EURY|nr:recombinase family protein [Haloferax marisrubri]POG54859.1 resolvase [Haloferax marisrubri]